MCPTEAKFSVRLNLDYKDWMNQPRINNEQIIQEISQALNVEKNVIEIKEIREGSVDIYYVVKNIWIQ